MAVITPESENSENANSYASIEFADSYFSDRGAVSWAAKNEAEKTAALIKATDYIDKRFGSEFIGNRETANQPLEWPRSNAIDGDGYTLEGIPTILKKATAEYALHTFDVTTLSPVPETPHGVRSTIEQVGPIRRGVTYIDQSDPRNAVLAYPEADLILTRLLRSQSVIFFERT